MRMERGVTGERKKGGENYVLTLLADKDFKMIKWEI